ncbi:MAG: hypothetical protein ACE5ER_01215 [Nitrospinaceae bacterium]
MHAILIHKRGFRPAPLQSEKSLLMPWLLLISIFMAAPGIAQEAPPEPAETENIRAILLLLSEQMEETQEKLKTFDGLPESQGTKERRVELLLQLDGLNRNFETIATQLQTGAAAANGDKDSDWLKQIQSITSPLLNALTNLTEKPRRIERLKKQVEILERQLAEAQTAARNVQTLLWAAPAAGEAEGNKTLGERLAALSRKYDPQLVQLQLKEARRSLEAEIQNTKPVMETVAQALREFFRTRGLNLLTTVVVFFALWWALMWLRALMVGKRRLIKLPAWMNKVLATAYSLLVLSICLMASMVSLYLLNDWLLLSIIILFLVAVVWASRQLIPRLFQEVRLALNLGTVKEQERLIWNGVPWLVETIGLQANLVNERLEGGAILLAVGELVGKHSRPRVENEPWFPTEVGDWVILADGVYGQVERQTQEQVVLKLKGGSRKFYSTAEFLAQTPMNISHGFRYEIDFGLDYAVQKRICDDIPLLFEEGLHREMAARFQEPDPDFTHLEIAFDHPGSSALNLKIILHGQGRLAKDHQEVRREIQRALVRICNANGLTLPFTQLTLNLAPDLKPLAAARNPAPPAS